MSQKKAKKDVYMGVKRMMRLSSANPLHVDNRQMLQGVGTNGQRYSHGKHSEPVKYPQHHKTSSTDRLRIGKLENFQ